MSKDDSLVQGLKDFTAGGASGVAQILSSHPLDTIKTRMQAESGQRFAGAWDLARHTVRNEGIVGLYKGMLSPLLGVAFVNSVLFAAFGRVARLVHPDATTPLSIGEVATAGAGAGFLQSIVASPIEMLKIRMQVQYESAPAERRYRGPGDCLRQLWAKHRFAGVFSGLGATTLRETPAYAAWYSMYEFVKRKLIPSNTTEISPVKLLTAGASGGVAYWTACYPLDRAKTMIQSMDLEHPPYRSSLQCLQSIVRKEGVLGLWRGFGPCLVRTLPASSCTFLTYEIASKLLNGK